MAYELPICFKHRFMSDIVALKHLSQTLEIRHVGAWLVDHGIDHHLEVRTVTKPGGNTGICFLVFNNDAEAIMFKMAFFHDQNLPDRQWNKFKPYGTTNIYGTTNL